MKRLLYLMRKFQTFHRYNVCSDVLFSILLIKNVKFAFEIFNNKSHYHAYFHPEMSINTAYARCRWSWCGIIVLFH